MRAVRFVDQEAAIGGSIEYRRLTPRRRDRFVVAEYAFPGRARVRRFDQGIGQVAQLAFVIGELELRRAQADASGRFGSDPSMHVIAEKILTGAAEISAAAAAEHDAECERHDPKKW